VGQSVVEWGRVGQSEIESGRVVRSEMAWDRERPSGTECNGVGCEREGGIGMVLG